MDIIRNHYTPGKKVKKFSEIVKVAEEMTQFMRSGGLKRNGYEQGYALAHNQMSETPYAFFVMNPDWPEKRLFASDIIINPELVETWREINIGTKKKPDMRNNVREYPEGCYSFPHRKAKNVPRYFRIKVTYLVPVSKENPFNKLKHFSGMSRITETIEGIPAHVFQHEEQHCRGKNIYYKK